MAETLRELVVSLSLQSDNFSKNIKSINAQIQEAESRFAAAGAGVDGFAKSTDGLKAKAGALTDKLRLQNQITQQYEKALKEATTALQKNEKKQKDLSASLATAKSRHAALKPQIDKVRAAYEQSAKETGENSEETNRLGVELLDLEEQYKATGEEVKGFEEKLNANARTMQNGADAVVKRETALNKSKAAEAALAAELRKTNKEIADSESKWKNAAKSLDNFGKSAQDAGTKMSKAGGSLTKYVTAPILALGTLAVKGASDFESAFAGVRKTVDMTEEEFAALDETLKEMTTVKPASYVDLAGLAEAAGQLGVANEYIAEFVSTIADLNEATNLVGEEGATQLAKFANIVGMSQKDFSRLGSTLVALGNNFATTEADIMALSMRLAGAGAQVGLSEAEILAFAAALSSVGIEAEAGGSAFSKVMIEMQLAAETGKNGLKDFAKVAGMSRKEFQKAWSEDPAKTIQAFIVGLSQMDEKGISAIRTLDKMGLSEVRLRDTLLRAANASDLFTGALETSSSAWEENTALTDEAAKRYETYESKMAMMANRAKLTMADFGENIIVAMNPALEKLNEVLDWFNSFDEDTQNKVLTAFAIFAATGPVVKAVGGTITAVGKVSSGLGALIGKAPQVAAVLANPATWGVAAGVGALALAGYAISQIKSDMEIITSKAAAIELQIDENSKNETLQAIAEVRKEIEGLSGGESAEQAAGVSATVKAGYGTSAMYGQALGYESTQMQSQIAKAGTEYQRQIDALNAEIVKAVELGDKTAADALSAQREQAYAAWDAEVLAIKDGYTQAISDIVDGMASQYPDAQAKIGSAMEQYTALKELDRFTRAPMSAPNRRELAVKILGMDGVAAALEEYGYGGMSAEQIYDTTTFATLALGLRDKLAASMTDALAQSADSPIYTVLASMLGDTGVVEGLDFSAIDGTLADGIALLDFKAAAAAAQEKGGDIGQYLTDGIGAGITGNKSTVNDDLIALRDAVVKQTRAAFEIGSPSKLMTREGLHIPEGVAKGISSGAYMVKNAMVKMAREAVQAARSELQIQSPSRTMRDEVGAMIPRGVVKGIEEETAKQQRAVQNAFRSLVQPALAGAQSGMAATNRTNHYSSTVSLAGANIVVRDQQDIRALALELNSLQVSQQRALGRV